MSRDTQHVLLALLGGALLRIAADGTYLRYVRPDHRWLLITAGVAMVVLAVVGIVADRRGDGHRDHGEHDHGGAERRAPWLLLAPVLVLALVAPPALGADAVARSPGAVVRDADVFAPLPPGDAPALPVAEFVQRAAWDSTGSLDGREVSLTGFVVRHGAATELARMSIACCAADARPHRVRLAGDLPALPADTWIRVRGVLQGGSATTATGYVPAMTVTGVEVVAAPPDPYEY
ncbi:MAG TPA: TIGR03943 family protein [Pseudonocardia sp.]|nr:TIGR03943 family protein [Pseudonocardia sp.]